MVRTEARSILAAASPASTASVIFTQLVGYLPAINSPCNH